MQPCFFLLTATPRFLLCCVFFAFSAVITSCYKPEPCRNEISSTAISPNGKLKAVVFKRICPYEQTMTTHISILRVDEELPDSNGNIFACTENVLTRVAWLRDDRLAVYTYGDLTKATKIEKVGEVIIEYSRIIETDLVPPIPERKKNSGG
jgi:hypothetical protein